VAKPPLTAPLFFSLQELQVSVTVPATDFRSRLTSLTFPKITLQFLSQYEQFNPVGSGGTGQLDGQFPENIGGILPTINRIKHNTENPANDRNWLDIFVSFAVLDLIITG
jgi:hypothetical protein